MTSQMNSASRRCIELSGVQRLATDLRPRPPARHRTSTMRILRHWDVQPSRNPAFALPTKLLCERWLRALAAGSRSGGRGRGAAEGRAEDEGFAWLEAQAAGRTVLAPAVWARGGCREQGEGRRCREQLRRLGGC